MKSVITWKRQWLSEQFPHVNFSNVPDKDVLNAYKILNGLIQDIRIDALLHVADLMEKQKVSVRYGTTDKIHNDTCEESKQLVLDVIDELKVF